MTYSSTGGHNHGWSVSGWPTPTYPTGRGLCPSGCDQTFVCNCACSVCLSGGCCMFTRPLTHSPLVTMPSSSSAVISYHVHRWQPVGLSQGDVVQSCECGEVRRVPVPE